MRKWGLVCVCVCVCVCACVCECVCECVCISRSYCDWIKLVIWMSDSVPSLSSWGLKLFVLIFHWTKFAAVQLNFALRHDFILLSPYVRKLFFRIVDQARHHSNMSAFNELGIRRFLSFLGADRTTNRHCRCFKNASGKIVVDKTAWRASEFRLYAHLDIICNWWKWGAWWTYFSL